MCLPGVASGWRTISAECTVLGLSKAPFRYLVKRADAARDARRFDAAAALFGEALRLRPDHQGVRIQYAHMLKETGQLDQAEQHYTEAQRLRPEDADLALQLGHFYKVAGRFGDAAEAYERALALRPGWEVAQHELGTLASAGRARTVPADPIAFGMEIGGRADAFGGMTAEQVRHLVPKLAPRRYDEMLLTHAEEVDLKWLGRRETTFWGNQRTLRGVEAIRGFCASETPIVEVHVLLDGARILRGPVKGGYVFKVERDRERIKKYVFNLWYDFSACPEGLHSVEVRCIDARGGMRLHHSDVVIARPIPEEKYPDSNHLVTIDPDDPRSLDAQVRARPSMVRAAKRALFPDGVRNVLVMRTDQLGDMVASIPALTRLRAMLPAANIVGLCTPANADLARTLGLFDEVIPVDFPDDRLERRRLMPLAKQEELRQMLVPYEFDIAIDLAQAGVSRDLLQLAGAKFTFGTGGEDWPWLTSDFMFHTRDRWTRHDFTPHSTKVLGLIESLGALLKTSAPIIRRDDLPRSLLEQYGLAAGDGYALLHAGARIGFSRWPFYADLARMFLERTDLKVVIMTEDPEFRGTLPPELLAEARVLYFDQRLPFDHFDAFVSHATVMTGNDSGPKHLASLRGTQVVTIFSARINWTEWGQENVGSIISRKLPCAGCALLHDPEECGRDFICISDIKAHEVFDAMMALIEQPQGEPA
jgi:ADP-heptose:LPS heptosyltransferase